MTQAAAGTRRIYWIDVLRGIAILLMIPANLAPYMVEPHPLWYRFLGSFAAPIFIMLSAGMVVLRANNHSFSYYIQRGLYVIIFGVFLDVVLWQILPFTSFDVLYTIGLGIVVVYLLRNADVRELLLLSVIIFLAAYAALQLFGYHKEALEVYYLENFFIPDFGRLLQSWFIDGWFPILPWIGFALLGAAFFKYTHEKGDALPVNRFLLIGTIFLAVGIALLFVPIPMYENFTSNQIIENRGGYSEVFYPPTPAYILCAIGVFLILVKIVSSISPNPVGDFISFFGRYSMLVYLAHQILGVVLIAPVISMFGVDYIFIGWFFAFANLAVIGIVYVVCQLVGHIKQRHPVRNSFLQVLVGK